MGWGLLEDGYDWLVSRNQTLQLRRRLVFAGRARLGIAQDFHAAGQHDALLATAHYFFISLVTVQAGTLSFRTGAGTRQMDAARFLFYVPAGALVRMPLHCAKVQTIGLTAHRAPPTWPTVALAIPCELGEDAAMNESALSAVLATASPAAHRIDADCGLPASMQRLRQKLYACARGSSPVGRVARDCGLAPAVLTRSFSAAFGLTPRDYCQRVRVHAAAVSLLGGLSIVQVGLASGWQDLSRFYRQFRHATGETPGRYRAARGRRPEVK